MPKTLRLPSEELGGTHCFVCGENGIVPSRGKAGKGLNRLAFNIGFMLSYIRLDKTLRNANKIKAESNRSFPPPVE